LKSGDIDWPSSCLNQGVINSFSVDVEDYFQTECMAPYAPRYTWESLPSRVVQSTSRLLDLFDEFEVKGTFFFLGWVAERYPALVRRAVERGHEIGCHSYAHHPVFRLTPESFRADTLLAKQLIEDAAGVAVKFYRAPSFSIVRSCSWAFAVLSELGFTQDSSVHPISHPTYGNPNAPRRPWQTASGIVEYPIATWRVLGRNLPVGGGAYLRIFPYQFVKTGVRSLNREGLPAVLYLHPWEIDPGQPRIATALKSRLRQYTGLESMESKLRHLMADFKLAPITQAFANVPLLQAPMFGQIARAEAA
jgi:polysaccharide deacetylase family protein (PEP-CTERM system associated)